MYVFCYNVFLFNKSICVTFSTLRSTLRNSKSTHSGDSAATVAFTHFCNPIIINDQDQLSLFREGFFFIISFHHYLYNYVIKTVTIIRIWMCAFISLCIYICLCVVYAYVMRGSSYLFFKNVIRKYFPVFRG